jgi:hypothetical protein
MRDEIVERDSKDTYEALRDAERALKHGLKRIQRSGEHGEIPSKAHLLECVGESYRFRNRLPSDDVQQDAG